jgi:hypothetical protein
MMTREYRNRESKPEMGREGDDIAPGHTEVQSMIDSAYLRLDWEWTMMASRKD